MYRIDEAIVPAHPRCRCILSPWSEKWQKRGWTDDAAVTEIHQQRLEEMAKLGTRPTDKPTPWERQRGMTSAPKPVWSPGDEVKPTPRRDSSRLPADHVIGNSPRVSADSLNRGLDAIRTPGGAERAQMFRDFVSRNNIQVVMHDVGGDERQHIRSVEANLKDRRYLDRVGGLRSNVTADPGAEGYTNAYYNHLVIRTSTKGRDGQFSVDPERLQAHSNKVLTGASGDDEQLMESTGSMLFHRDTREFVTYMHEMGHQVYFKGGIPPIPQDIAGSATDYGAENEHEWFAEHFALWMMDEEGYSALDAVGSSFIRSTLERATQNPVTIEELENR